MSRGWIRILTGRSSQTRTRSKVGKRSSQTNTRLARYVYSKWWKFTNNLVTRKIKLPLPPYYSSGRITESWHRDFFFGIPLCRQGGPSPSIPRPHSEISQAELPAFRSSSFLGGASSENSNPTSGHLKVKILNQPLVT